MNFGQALKALQQGHRVARSGWHEKGVYLELQVPNEHSKMTLPYIFMETGSHRVPWVPSQTDILSEDWWFTFRGLEEN